MPRSLRLSLLSLVAALGLCVPPGHAADPAAETAPKAAADRSPAKKAAAPAQKAPTVIKGGEKKSSAKKTPEAKAAKKPAERTGAATTTLKSTPIKKANSDKSVGKAALKKPADPKKKTGKPVDAALLKPLLSERDRALYKEAFAKARDGRFSEANGLAAQAKEKLPAKLLRVLELASIGDFTSVVAFIESNPDWPYLNTLRQRAEEHAASQGDDVMLAWFSRNPPQGWKGMQALGELYQRIGRGEEAQELIRAAWVAANIDALEERQFVARHRTVLTEKDHVARLDRLLWDNQVPAARRMMTRVDEPYRRLAEARIRLMRREGGVDGALAKVPPGLQRDPGLIFDRLRFRRRSNDMEGARDLLLNLPHDLARPGEWWTELSYVIRRSLQAGDVSLAYRLAKDHRQDGGPSLAEAEFLAGWISLRFLRDHAEARLHFKTLYESVRYPVSLARAAYWSGRAATDAGDRAAARTWYERAAKHGTTFYGQLAAGLLGLDPATILAPEGDPTPPQVAAFDKAEIPRLTRMMAEIGERDRMKLLFRHMAQLAQGTQEFALVARLALAMDLPDLAVRVARMAERAGAPLTVSGYPVLALKPAADGLDLALVHAVIRQESGFDREAVSRAGARGLMQLMPDTARLVAKEMQVGYQVGALTDDPHYNVSLGRRYLKAMIEDLGGVPAALAAYNAGPNRSRRWMRDYGDPRVDEESMVDWIEMIPFDETRSYVQRVMENRFVYRVRLDGGAPQTTAASAAAPAVAPR
ncbi:MAG: transglycosylase SLT domain-containing protein [Alphaproteobacteria bacterium]|nr:transglycosylase SLT domain-containing protein [Alphaproteobacteria bacterium]